MSSPDAFKGSESVVVTPKGNDDQSLSEMEKATHQEYCQNEPQISKDWSDEEELRLRKKLDYTLLPLLILGLFALQLDKGNISYALTTSFTKDLGITNNDVNYGNNLMQAGIVIFEVPFNMVLSRIGPSLWLTIQVFIWGTIATAQTAISNKGSFYATRFLLGTWEAGYLAASLIILASFYTRKEMAMRVTLVYIGNFFSQGVGGLLAAAIFNIPESSGLKQWQWLFLVDGIFTLAVGFLFIFFLPGSASKTVPVCGIKKLDFFSDRERHVLNNRVILDDPRKVVRLSGIGLKRVLRIFANPRLWGHAAINVIVMSPKGGLVLYSPTIIKNLGFATIPANALASVSSYGACVFAVTVAWLSDRTSIRGPFIMGVAVYCIVMAGVQFGVVASNNVWLKYAILTLLNCGNSVAQTINDAWLSTNTMDPQHRCIGLAMAVGGSNLGGLAGQNLFVQSDAPFYRTGFLRILCLYAGSLGLIAIMIYVYWKENRTMAKNMDDNQIINENGVDVVVGDGRTLRVKNQI